MCSKNLLYILSMSICIPKDVKEIEIFCNHKKIGMIHLCPYTSQKDVREVEIFCDYIEKRKADMIIYK